MYQPLLSSVDFFGLYHIKYDEYQKAYIIIHLSTCNRGHSLLFNSSTSIKPSCTPKLIKSISTDQSSRASQKLQQGLFHSRHYRIPKYRQKHSP